MVSDAYARSMRVCKVYTEMEALHLTLQGSRTSVYLYAAPRKEENGELGCVRCSRDFYKPKLTSRTTVHCAVKTRENSWRYYKPEPREAFPSRLRRRINLF